MVAECCSFDRIQS